jgi:hypothetical protein
MNLVAALPELLVQLNGTTSPNKDVAVSASLQRNDSGVVALQHPWGDCRGHWF